LGQDYLPSINASLRIDVFYCPITGMILKDIYATQTNTLEKLETIINLKMVVNCKSLTQIRIAAKNCLQVQAPAAFGTICQNLSNQHLKGGRDHGRKNFDFREKYVTAHHGSS